ncbi:hypothetical protein AB4865_10375 [Capnocytophaga sp. ARDL2]|uniref:hypothetical protein n=1 Tax=Capnocytophaga sp. ARDL2 TaxID=3238809 RepID=UPI003558B03E
MLLEHNLSGGLPIVEDTNALQPTASSFITLYDYTMVYQPDLFKELLFSYGSGSIQEFIDLTTGKRDNSFASDVIKHAEMGRLHNVLKGVTISGNNFTSPKAHGLQPRDVIKISNGSEETQATVQSVTSPTVFVATNDKGSGFSGFTTVTVLADFSNRYPKGSEAPTRGKVWEPKFRENYPQIIKSFFSVAESDMASTTWLRLPDGTHRWFNLNLERNMLLHDNKVELNAILHERVKSGSDTFNADSNNLGMKGLVQIVEEGGNIGNDYIKNLDYLSAIAKRAKIEGTCREFTFWCDHEQMRYFREMCAGLNASFVNGSHYGAFKNDKDMALRLDFSSVHLDGVTFHFKPWKLLDDPTLLGAAGFSNTSLAYVGIPTGQKNEVKIDGVTHLKPYFDVLYKRLGQVDRKKKIKFFGLLGVEQSKDESSVEAITEATTRVVGANNFFVGRRDDSFYP